MVGIVQEDMGTTGTVACDSSGFSAAVQSDEMLVKLAKMTRDAAGHWSPVVGDGDAIRCPVPGLDGTDDLDGAEFFKAQGAPVILAHIGGVLCVVGDYEPADETCT